MSAASASSRVDDDDRVYDEDVRVMVDAMRARRSPSLQSTGVGPARDALESISRPPGPPDMQTVRRVEFEGPHGRVPVRVYRPHGAPEQTAPVVVWFHGGGMIMGSSSRSIASHGRLPPRRTLSLSTSAIGSHRNIDIRSRTTRRTRPCAGYGKLPRGGGVWTPDRIAVGGDSAGGGLAAATALRARNEGGPRLRSRSSSIPDSNDVVIDRPCARSPTVRSCVPRTSTG